MRSLLAAGDVLVVLSAKADLVTSTYSRLDRSRMHPVKINIDISYIEINALAKKQKKLHNNEMR